MVMLRKAVPREPTVFMRTQLIRRARAAGVEFKNDQEIADYWSAVLFGWRSMWDDYSSAPAAYPTDEQVAQTADPPSDPSGEIEVSANRATGTVRLMIGGIGALNMPADSAAKIAEALANAALSATPTQGEG